MNHHDPIIKYGSWLAGVRSWVKGAHEKDPSFPDFPPTEETKMFTAETAKNQPMIQILSPVTFSVVSEYKIPITVSVDAPHGVQKVSFFLDERTVPNSTKTAFPYTGLIRFSTTTKLGIHTITAKVYDELGYVGEAKIEVRFEPEAAPEPAPPAPAPAEPEAAPPPSPLPAPVSP